MLFHLVLLKALDKVHCPHFMDKEMEKLSGLPKVN